MIEIRFEEREKIGLQYILESLHGCSPFGQERIRRLRYYTPDERQELELELRNVERAAAHAEELKDLYDQICVVLCQMKDIRGSLRRCRELEVPDHVELFELKGYLQRLETLRPLFEKLRDTAGLTGLAFHDPAAALAILDPENTRSRGFYIPDAATLATTEYRSKKELDGPVRLVEAGGDCCACCGTHLARTGEVGLIKIISAQHYKTGMRLAVACGQRAYDAVAAICADAEAAGRVLSAPAGSLTPSVENRQNGEAVLKQRIAALQNALADAYVQAAAPDRPAVLWAEGADGDGLRRIAMAVCAGINQVACALAPGGQGLSYALAAPDGTDARALGRALNEAFAGRGGGKPAFCQGSLAQPGLTPDVVREKLSTLL